MVRAMRKVQIKCDGGSAEGAAPAAGGSGRASWKTWLLHGPRRKTEASVPGGEDTLGDENSESEGTETGNPGTPSRNDSGGRVDAKEERRPRWAIRNGRMKTGALLCGPGEL